MDVPGPAPRDMTGLAGATIVFRVDASLQIGTGHVMRCLTLAQALKAAGARCRFVCRAHQGHLIEHVSSLGFHASTLAAPSSSFTVAPDAPTHSAWLGCEASIDAQETIASIASTRPAWMVVDHYALDAAWEAEVRRHVARVMVIDDLVDRPHLCDLLLDQTVGRREGDYSTLVPASSRLLTGSSYALLRPEFAALRPYSLRRRVSSGLNEVLIAMGGVDSADATGRTLIALRGCDLPPACRLTVALGWTNQWQTSVRESAALMPWATQVLVGISDMAQRMADSDLTIGAASGMSWERCCLGLPSVLVVLADNQREAAKRLEDRGAAVVVGLDASFDAHLRSTMQQLLSDSDRLGGMSNAAQELVDGMGCQRVVSEILQIAPVWG
jgi:UDP-2,4-diacetamido-2,4,6-trideoxy-beta-L-altropyranose hydrolase